MAINSNVNDFHNSEASFKFDGIYRARVEDNKDPIDAGRIRVRIEGIHSIDSKLTPIEHLPWAEPCLKVYKSGGKNIHNNRDDENKEMFDDKGTSPPERTTKKLVKEYKDPTKKNDGTGGEFVVPDRGNSVFIFFEGKDFTKPLYFAMAPKATDWKNQKKKTTTEVNEIIKKIGETRDKFTVDAELHTGSHTITKDIKIQTLTAKPKMRIEPIDKNKMYEMSSFTTMGGVTYIFVLKDGEERTYIIQKGKLSYVDQYGQSKEYIGSTKKIKDIESDKQKEEVDNDSQITINNNHELHILGDYTLFTEKNHHLQINGDTQINTRGQVGIVSREGDVNIKVEKGNLSAEVKQNCSLYVEGDLQQKIKGNLKTEVEGDYNLKVKGNIDTTGEQAINTKAGLEMNLKSGLATNIKALNIHNNADIKIDQSAGVLLVQGAPLISSAASAMNNISASMIGIDGAIVGIGGFVSLGGGWSGQDSDPCKPPDPNKLDFVENSRGSNQSANPAGISEQGS